MAKEFDKQAWLRFVLGAIAFFGIAWGASSNFTTTNDRSIRNTSDVAIIKSDAKEAQKNNAVEFKELRSITSQIRLENAEAKTMQQTILSRLDKIENQGDRNHSEIMAFIRTWEKSE